jgi:hypothetical protein
LEANEDYVLTSHRFESYNVETEQWLPEQFSYPHLLKDIIEGYSFDFEDGVLKHWLVKTLTVVFRKDKLNLNLLTQYKYCRDFHLHYHLLQHGKGYYFNFIGGVYQFHDGGIHSKINNYKRQQTAYKIYDEFYKLNKNQLSKVSQLAILRYMNAYLITYESLPLKLTVYLFIQYLFFTPRKIFGYMKMIYHCMKNRHKRCNATNTDKT